MANKDLVWGSIGLLNSQLSSQAFFRIFVLKQKGEKLIKRYKDAIAEPLEMKWKSDQFSFSCSSSSYIILASLPLQAAGTDLHQMTAKWNANFAHASHTMPAAIQSTCPVLDFFEPR